MFTYAIRNIVQKQSIPNINILYYPSKDLIDDIITNLDANFFIERDSSAENNKIYKDNVCYLSNVSLFEYDFIFAYEVNDTLLDMSSKLHIPIIVYLKYGSYDDSKIPDYKNLYYILEHQTESEQEKLLTIIPQIDIKIQNEQDNICLFISTDNNYGNIIQLITSKIKNLSIVDEDKIDQKAMIEILSKHKVCLDLYPKSIYKMLFCAQGNLPYITVSNFVTEKYKNIYEGVYFMQPNLDLLINLLKTLVSETASYKNNLQKSVKENQIEVFLNKVKKKGMIL